jgi:hypothetical protein
MAVAADRGHDDVWLELCQFLVVESSTLHHTGGEVIDDHIAFPDQLLGDGNPFRFSQIHEHTLFPLTPLVKEGTAIYTRFYIRRVQRQTPGVWLLLDE